jgi:hypothetical protein
METSVRFIDCPACGLPAEIEDLYCLRSTDGPVDSARIRCPRSHWYNGPLDTLIPDDKVRTLRGGMAWVTGQTGQRS